MKMIMKMKLILLAACLVLSGCGGEPKVNDFPCTTGTNHPYGKWIDGDGKKIRSDWQVRHCNECGLRQAIWR